MEVILTVAVVVALMYSIILHEVAHGAVAYLNGDPTAKAMKRLTLNPIRHVDIVGTVILPLVLFFMHSPFLLGWAKPVPYNPLYFKNQRVGTFTVGIAGVAVNLLLAIVFALCINSLPPGEWTKVFSYGLSMNLILAIFNLIPIPPLDGSRVLSVFFPKAMAQRFLSLDKIGMIVILILLYFSLLSRILMPAHNFLYQWLTRA